MTAESNVRDTEEPRGTISFSVRLTERQRDLLSRAAEKRGWSLSSLLKNAALEKAVHILNTSAPNRIDFRRTAEEIARQVFAPRSGTTLDRNGEPVPVLMMSLEEARQDHQVNPIPVEQSPGPPPSEFLTDVRDAARYGGTEFLDLIIEAAEAITTRQGNLPDPIDPSSI
jgi:uncharacterized protein (DUF1778 family)